MKLQIIINYTFSLTCIFLITILKFSHPLRIIIESIWKQAGDVYGELYTIERTASVHNNGLYYYLMTTDNFTDIQNMISVF